MKAIVQDRYGSPDVLELRDVDAPVPSDIEVLVRVHAASVNARDWHVMRGDPYLARASIGLRAPQARIRGTDFAGRIESVGGEVTDLSPGDAVFGEADGAFAEYVNAPASAVARKPDAVTFAQAAALPTAGNTALMGLRDVAQLERGQHVLVNGASGGVGTFAVQLAAHFGAEVTAVCSTRNTDLVSSLGADHVVDYSRTDFAAAGQRYDVVLDLVGNRSLRDLRRVLRPGGVLVLSGGGVSTGGSVFGPLGLMVRARLLSPLVKQAVLQFLATPRRENLTTLGALVKSGAVHPVIDRTYPLSEAPAAIRYLENEHARAKVVIAV
ncbi:NAD(P)-dependent alcohol dehydrogenase [Jiangella asiatica]|uniref:NAD(P)-dependent alcohol dehydrogenase n=1 Tax=Jiangella asiatica TaxID=2530372 RepID=A0A4R5C6U5_9ACTN|nr:NAD(P)-dependent alcohol dehydrogenase [Jiangella asiatica]TDD95418.1 NAD(P)-dependent alcohol dehydrogenase [Jiangella asiatica]